MEQQPHGGGGPAAQEHRSERGTTGKDMPAPRDEQAGQAGDQEDAPSVPGHIMLLAITHRRRQAILQDKEMDAL